MVSTFQMQNFYRAPLTVDTNHAQIFEEEDNSLLEESILDQSSLDSGLEMSPHMPDSRRDSYSVASTLFSPKSEDWQSVDMQSVPSNNPFLEQHGTGNPFMPVNQAAAYTHQGPAGQAWSISSSGSATPLQSFDGVHADFDSGSSLFQRPPTMQVPTPFGNPANHVAMFQQLGPHQHPGGASLPASPVKDGQWISQDLKSQVMARRNRPNSPLLRSHNDLRRGDGIRKKNARFDIPAERNLSNIDHLISQSTDEQEVKELKQQKRLLRNRQAALDSRQRKKQHTERLEDEKKQYTEVMGHMESEIDELKAQMELLLREKQQYSEYIETLALEKEEMIRTHTIETGELRKKIGVLTTHVQTLEGSAMAATSMPGQHGHQFPVATFGDMEGISMDGSSWDNMPPLFGDFPMDPSAAEADIKQEMQISVPPAAPTKKAPEAESLTDKPLQQQGGLLFMLFLVGAFVLSSRSTTPAIPRVSEDVRAASATLLENVLKDAGVPQPPQSSPSASLGATMGQPAAAGGSWTAQPSSSMLGQLADTLTAPRAAQNAQQLFSLSAAQYNGVMGSPPSSSRPTPSPAERRNLAEALAHMRAADDKNRGSAAEVYTRSLLWDQIPGDVVRSFARMVAECNGATADGRQQQQQQQCSDMEIGCGDDTEM